MKNAGEFNAPLLWEPGSPEIGISKAGAGAASPSCPALLSRALKGANVAGEKVWSTYFILDANSIQGDHLLVLTRTAGPGDFWVCRIAWSSSQLQINMTKISTFPFPRPEFLLTGRDWCAGTGVHGLAATSWALMIKPRCLYSHHPISMNLIIVVRAGFKARAGRWKGNC